MRIPNTTHVRFVPDERRDDPQEKHTGKVIYFTTDGFYRVAWDKNNPRPDFFNTERVFRPEQLEPMRRLALVRLDLTLELDNPGNPDTQDNIKSVLRQYLADNDVVGHGLYQVVDKWLEPR